MESGDDGFITISNNVDRSGNSDNMLDILNSPRRNLSPSHEIHSRRLSRSRSRSYDNKRRRSSRSASLHRSRSPRRQRSHYRNDRSRDRSRDRRDNQNRHSNSRRYERDKKRYDQLDRELGLKYRWEKTVYVSNIPYDYRWTDLKDLFRDKVGEIMYCEVFEKDGRSQGVAAIEFKTEKDAERAVRVMHQYDMGGRKISVRIDGEGYKTRLAKESAIESSKDSSSRSNNTNSSNKSSSGEAAAAGGSTAIAQLVKSNLMNLLGMGNTLTSNSSNSSNSQTVLLNQLASQLKVDGPITNRIFIASLDYKVDEKKLKEVFSMAGNLLNCEMFRDRDGKSRGMAVLEYDTPFGALNAVSMFNQQTLLDRQMTVRFDTKPPNENENDKNIKLPSGLKSIGKSILPTNPTVSNNLNDTLSSITSNNDSSLSLLSGLGLNLNTSLPSLMSNEKSNNSNVNNQTQSLMGLNTNNNSIIKGNTDPRLKNGAHHNNNQVNTINKVFVKNIPFTWDSKKLKEKFKQAGNIEFTEIKTRNGQSRGCALIRYSTPEQAVKGVELFNGSRFEGRTLEVNLDKMA